MRFRTVAAAISAVLISGVSFITPAYANMQHHGLDPLFGVNASAFAQASSETSGLTSERLYVDGGAPSVWPQQSPGVTGIYSFKPDVVQVGSGALDSQIVTSLRKLPAGSWVTIWSEGNADRAGFTTSQYTKAVKRVAFLVAKNNIPVKFGQIFAMYPVDTKGQDLRPWVVPALNFYAFDGYQQPSHTQTPADVFGAAVGFVRDVYGPANLAITETNVRSPLNTTQTDQWALAAWKYACGQNVSAFALFASDSTSTFLPDAATMKTLSSKVASNSC